jgi:flagellar biosynthesis protein FlhF
MKIKKYTEKSFNDGKKKILQDLGEDAIILSTRTVQDKDGNPVVEIVAAIDEKEMQKQQAKRPVKEKLSGLDSLLKMTGQAKPEENRVKNYQDQDLYGEVLKIKSELNELKEILKYKFASSLNENFSKVYKVLIDSGLSEKQSLKLISDVSASDPNMSFEDGLNAVRSIFLNDIKLNPTIRNKDKQVISFVGITGSGKTLTLIKLAIISKLVWSKKVMIVSSDTKKIGGADQLETYAAISTIPFKKVDSPKEIKRIVSENEDYDIIFLDTSGLNHKNQKDLFEVMDYVKAAKSNRVILVQNSATNVKTMRDIIEKFIPLGITEMILSKVDEAESIGEVLSIIMEYQIPLSFLTYGQSVPDDIVPVSKEKLGQFAIQNPKNRVSYNTLFKEDF